MAEQESIKLNPRTYDKLGIVHCGVIREGRISVAGNVADLDDGQQIEMYDGRIKVARQGEDYTFTRAA